MSLQGTGYIYDAVLRPYVTSHESDIEKKLLEWRARIWDLAVFYLQNCTEFGESAVLQVLEYFVDQSKRFSSKSNPTALVNSSLHFVLNHVVLVHHCQNKAY